MNEKQGRLIALLRMLQSILILAAAITTILAFLAIEANPFSPFTTTNLVLAYVCVVGFFLVNAYIRDLEEDEDL